MQRARGLSTPVAMIAIAVGAAMASGCAPRLTVDPEAARPGAAVRLRAEQPLFREGTQPRVRINGKPATVLRRVSDQEVDVLVPAIGPGSARVAVAGSGGGRVTVLASPSLELVMSLKDGKVALVRATPRAGEAHSRVLRDQPRLSYDVINQQGGLVFSGVIADPGRREVFDGPNAAGAVLHGAPPDRETVFAVKVPHVAGRFTVKFYQVPAGADLATETGRTQRKPIGEIVIDRKEKP